jgi:DNA polymerase-3 subunit delta
MTALKAHEVERFIAKPDRSIALFLIYGNDTGLISERASRLAAALLGKNTDPLSIIRLESSEVASDPARLADEAYAIPMFGGDRVIRVDVSGNRPIHAILEPLIKDPPTGTWIILEAGELRRDHALRKLFEGAKGGAMALPSYADEARDLDRVIDEELKASGLTIAPDARELLRSVLGGDRLATRQEVQKLCLYAAGQGEITEADVRAAVGDVSMLAADDTIEAMLSGDVGAFERGLHRHRAAGLSVVSMASSALRQLQSLHRTRASIDAGLSVSQILEGQRGISFQRKRALDRQLRLWTTASLERALARLESGLLNSRLNYSLAAEILSESLLAIAREAARLGRAKDAA